MIPCFPLYLFIFTFITFNLFPYAIIFHTFNFLEVVFYFPHFPFLSRQHFPLSFITAIPNKALIIVPIYINFLHAFTIFLLHHNFLYDSECMHSTKSLRVYYQNTYLSFSSYDRQESDVYFVSSAYFM